MKKTLLIAAVSASFLGNTQTMTQANEPTVGLSTNMYLCDSFTVDLAGITGTNVTWDFTGLTGIPNQTRIVAAIDPATSSNAADFPSSTLALTVESSMNSFMTSTATERVSQGFTFFEQSLGDVLVKFSGLPELELEDDGEAPEDDSILNLNGILQMWKSRIDFGCEMDSNDLFFKYKQTMRI